MTAADQRSDGQTVNEGNGTGANPESSRLVSILIPCFNAEGSIERAIESALAQTWSNTEVIVVDDGSTDASVKRIARYGARIRWETGPNRGGNAARNRLLELARGDWLQYLDADDYLLPRKIADQMEFLLGQSTGRNGSVAADPTKTSTEKDIDVVFGPVILEHVDGAGARQELLPIPAPHDPWVLLARWYLPQTGAPLWRKSAIEDVGGWAEGQPCCQEHELYLRLLIAGKRFQYTPHSGAVYRQWSEQTVCKRDKPLVYRERLRIEDRIEDFLAGERGLTAERRRAVNQARFEMARLVVGSTPAWANAIIDRVRQSAPDFVPGGAAAPMLYRTAYRLLGFDGAEKLAAAGRRLRTRLRPSRR